jgi:phosphoserine/homoserine phosphotransferase
MYQVTPTFFASDLEGVLIPEIWIAVAEKTKIEELFLTTREIADYDALMKMRLEKLNQAGLKMADIEEIIDGMDPLPGAAEFVQWVRNRSQFVIITDSFYQFIAPFMRKLGLPTVFAHSLQVADDGTVTGYQLRLQQGKRKAIDALQSIGFQVMATGDSYNDTAMLAQANRGILFNPPDNVKAEFPQFPVATSYDDLKAHATPFFIGK